MFAKFSGVKSQAGVFPKSLARQIFSRVGSLSKISSFCESVQRKLSFFSDFFSLYLSNS
jgi:hypothetical protein